MDPNRNPNGGGMSSVSGRVQRGPTTMASASGTYVPGPTTMANARATYVPGPTTMANARGAFQPSVQQALDTVVENYVDTNESARTGLNSRRQTQKAEQAATQAQDYLDQLIGQMYETSGGPDYAAIRQLEAQRAAAQKNYKTNRADAQNMYGMLSQDIQDSSEKLQGAYTGAIGETTAMAEKRQTGLSEEQKRQQANRERAAAELGIAPESIQTSYASDQALNEGMSDVAASAGSWENLLRAQQGSALERAGQMSTAVGNTRNQTILGMKALLDQQQAQLNAAIAAEKSKTPTQKLTSLGKLLQNSINDQTLREAQTQFPEIFGAAEQVLTSGQKAQQEIMTEWGLTLPQYNTLKDSAWQKYQARAAGNRSEATLLSQQEAAILNSLGYRQDLMGG